MKQEINPVVAIISAVGIVVVAVVIWFVVSSRSEQAKSRGMPPQVQQQWDQYTRGANKGSSIPMAGTPQAGGMPGGGAPPMGGGSAPGMPGGIPTGPVGGR